MDALPIIEATGLEYVSNNPGVMHACGHDGHTSILLAAARYLAEAGQFSGTLHVIFQPAEEIGAGARRMIEGGLFDSFPVTQSTGCTIGLACLPATLDLLQALQWHLLIVQRSGSMAVAVMARSRINPLIRLLLRHPLFWRFKRWFRAISIRLIWPW